MSNELYISATQKGDRIALVQDKRLIEYHFDETEHQFSVGDIYLGTVKKVVAGNNAAFVDVGYDKDGFLHYNEIISYYSLNKFVKDVIAKRPVNLRLKGFQLEKDIDKFGKINDVIQRNSPVLVQVVKEPISTKGPRLSCDISIAGRYVVLVPFGNSVNISKKITNKQERSRLHKMVSSVKLENFGVIVRTVAENQDLDELRRDLEYCVDKWEMGMKALRDAKPNDRIISEMDRASSILRDMLNDDFDSIVVDTKETFDSLKTLLHSIAPNKEKILKLHNPTKTKLFEQYGIEKQLKSLFGRSVSLPGGGYLIIEHTEALHVIDVNSGNKSTQEDDQEATALTVNIEAAKEIARQLRMRDMGGIIVIDFIDMKKPENKRLIQEAMREEMKGDRSKYTILPISKFGLLQITRQRVRPEMNISTRETCPTCSGTGTIQASINVTDLIENNLEYLLSKQNEQGIAIVLHPFVYSYYKEGIISRQVKWYLKYKRWIKLIKDTSIGITEFHFIDKNGDEIEINN